MIWLKPTKNLRDIKRTKRDADKFVKQTLREPKMFGGLMQKIKNKKLKDKEKKKSIKEKIAPKKKMDRLKELKEQLKIMAGKGLYANIHAKKKKRR